MYTNVVEQVLEYLMSIFSVKAHDKNITLDFIIDPSMPDCMFIGDSHRLLQVCILIPSFALPRPSPPFSN